MLYDKSNKRIKVKAKEFVSISRRRFSPTLPFDIDEPRGSDHPKRTNDVGHSTVFTLDGLDYELICEDYKFEDGELNIERFIESSPDHPRKEEISQIRGEGYINAYVIASEEGLDCVSIAFTYVNIITGDCKSVCESVSFSRLCAFFDKCANAVKMYATPEIQRVTERVPSFSAIRFPYPTVREPQREFISSAYKTLARGGKLFASAPTGTGKTISAIYPAIRGLGDEKFDKIFYFTPKTTTAIAAAECLELLSEKGAKRSCMSSIAR